MVKLLKWILLFLILLFLISFLVSCSVEHKIPPIKVEKIEVQHKISSIIVRMPRGEEFFKADPNCKFIDQISQADLGAFCSEPQKYMYDCCTIDFSTAKNTCIMEFCVKKKDASQGCVQIKEGCIQ